MPLPGAPPDEDAGTVGDRGSQHDDEHLNAQPCTALSLPVLDDLGNASKEKCDCHGPVSNTQHTYGVSRCKSGQPK